MEPLHLLNSFTEEIFALDTKKSYLRKQIKIERIMTVDLNRSAALALFQKKTKEKSHFPTLFWLSRTNGG